MNRTGNQVFRFLVTGIICFFIDYLSLILLTEVFHLHYLLSSAISFSISVIANYVMSVKYVFDVKNSKSGVENFFVFVVLSIIGLLITQAIMYFGTECFYVSSFIVKIFATFVVMIFNFITRKVYLERDI